MSTILVMYYVPEEDDPNSYPATPNAFVYPNAHSGWKPSAR